MTLQEYTNKLQKFMNENPSAKDAEIVEFSSIDECHVMVDDIDITNTHQKFDGYFDHKARYTPGNYVIFHNCY